MSEHNFSIKNSPTGPSAFRYRSGLGHTPAYVVSGKPFAMGGLSGSVTVLFPAVTRWVRIINQAPPGDGDLKCAFSANGLTGDNYFTLPDRSSGGSRTGHNIASFELKVTEMYFEGSPNFDVVAGLTNISVDEIPQNWSGSSGVG